MSEREKSVQDLAVAAATARDAGVIVDFEAMFFMVAKAWYESQEREKNDE